MTQYARIAEHEHIPEVVAAELGQELLKSPEGRSRIRRLMEENLELAAQGGEQDKAAHWKRVLDRFVTASTKRGIGTTAASDK